MTHYQFGSRSIVRFTCIAAGSNSFTLEIIITVIVPVFNLLIPLQELTWWVQLESRMVLHFTPNNKDFLQINMAEIDWSLEILKNLCFFLISLYLDTCCCLRHLTKFYQKSINKSSWASARLSAISPFIVACNCFPLIICFSCLTSVVNRLHCFTFITRFIPFTLCTFLCFSVTKFLTSSIKYCTLLQWPGWNLNSDLLPVTIFTTWNDHYLQQNHCLWLPQSLLNHYCQLLLWHQVCHNL